MSEEYSVAGLADVAKDEAADRAGADRLAAFWNQPAPPRWRGSTFPAVVGSVAREGGVLGRTLIARCPRTTQQRYHTLLHFEQALRPGDDCALLIAAACQLVEAELNRLLSDPAKSIADALIGVLREQRKHNFAELLTSWSEKHQPATLATHVALLLSLHYGHRQRIKEVEDFLTEHFEARYGELLEGTELVGCLDTIRSRYRNPASHGSALFDRTGYEDFLRLILSQQYFRAWDTQGATPLDPGGSTGLFHQHLRLMRRFAEGSVPPVEVPAKVSLSPLLERAIESDRVWPVLVESELTRAGERRARGLGAARQNPPQTFQKGDHLRLIVDAPRSGHLLLLNQGSEGVIYCLCPSQFAPQTAVVPGPNTYPQAQGCFTSFELSGGEGRENLLAILSDGPLGLEWLSREGDQPARQLGQQDVEVLLERLSTLSAESWLALRTSFDVQSGPKNADTKR